MKKALHFAALFVFEKTKSRLMAYQQPMVASFHQIPNTFLRKSKICQIVKSSISCQS